MSKTLGGTPNRCLKLREKSEDEAKPHARAMLVNDAGRWWAIKPSAFSRRSRFKKSAGVSPRSAETRDENDMARIVLPGRHR